MNNKVVPLNSERVSHISTANNEPESFADDLSKLAKEAEAGQFDGNRGMMIYQDKKGQLGYRMLGRTLSNLETIGVCAWMMQEIFDLD